jgi:hypothetical protein
MIDSPLMLISAWPRPRSCSAASTALRSGTRAAGLHGPQALRFFLNLGLGGALALQPLGILHLQRFDLLCGERLRDSTPGEAGDGDTHLRGDDRPGMRAATA